MLLKILFVGCLIAGVMFAIKDGRILRNAGLIGSCQETTVPSFAHGSNAGERWLSCKKGKLDGRPNPSQSGCTSQGIDAGVEYWVCPDSLQSSPLQ